MSPPIINLLRCAQTALAAAMIAGGHAGLIRVTWMLPASALLLLVGFFLAGKRLGAAAVAIAGFLTALPVILIAAGGWLTLQPSGLSEILYEPVFTLVVATLTWAAVLPWWGVDSERVDAAVRAVGPRETIGAIGLFVLLALIGRQVGGHPVVFTVDEMLYQFQASQLLERSRGMALEPWLEPFFRVRQTFVHDGVLSGQYPPGWPAVIAVFRVLGIESLAPLAVYTLSLVGVAGLARSLAADWETTLLSVVLTGAAFVHFDIGASYFSHGVTALFGLGAAIAAVRATRPDANGSTVVPWLIAGVFVGLALAARPLDGAVAAVVLGGWMVRHRAVRPGPVAAVSLGGLMPVSALLAYNRFMTGDAFTFGYDLAHGGLQALGYGPRGEVWFDPSGIPVERVIDFRPLDGLGHFMTDLGEGLQEFWPGGLILLLAFGALTAGRRLPVARVLPFLVLPAVHAAYFFWDTRLFYETLPFAMVATAVATAHVRSFGSGLGRPVVLASIIVALAATVGGVSSWAGMETTRMAYFQAVETAREEHGPLLVFVAQERDEGVGTVERGLEALYWYNTHSDGKVIVGRDVVGLRGRIAERFPDHTPIRFISGSEDGSGHWVAPEVEVLPGVGVGR